MKKKSSRLRQSLLLFSGLSGLAALSGCDILDIHNPLSADRPAQVVEGGRHAPALNPKNVPATQTALPGQPPMKGYNSDPYDYFNAKEQPAPTPAPAPVAAPAVVSAPAPLPAPAPAPASQIVTPPSAQQQSENTFLNHVVHSGTSERKPLPNNPNATTASDLKPLTVSPPAAPQMEVAPDATITPSAPLKDEALQTPDAGTTAADGSSPAVFSDIGHWFKSHADNSDEATGNSGTVKGEAPADTAPPVRSKNMSTVYVAPQAEEAPAKAADAPAKAADVVVEKSADTSAPVVAPSAAQTTGNAEANPTLGKRIADIFDTPSDTSHEEKLPQPGADATYPALSSVPPTPDQFQAVKTTKDANIKDLQTEHTLAQQDKQALDSEPSGQQATHPVEMPVADTAAPDAAPLAVPPAPAAAPSKPLLPLADAPVAAPAAKGQTLLGHASTPPDQDFSTQSAEVAPALPPPAPPAASTPTTSVATTPPASKSYWWQNANPFGSDKKPASDSSTANSSMDSDTSADTSSSAPPLSQPPMMNEAPSVPVPFAPQAPVVQTVPPITVATPVTPTPPTPPSAPLADAVVKAAPAEIAPPPPPPPPAPVAAKPPVPSAPASAQNAKTSSNPDDNTLPTPEMLKAARMLPPAEDPNAP